MADLDSVRFPPLISFNAIGGPKFLTSIAVVASGRESRTQIWERERGEWSVSHHARLPAEWEELLAFFRVVAGMANTFRFKDWTDYVCAVGAGLFVDATDGSPLGKQMVKRYSFGGYTYDRVITKPVSGKITTDASGLDYSTGIATSGTTWSGEFDVHARLDADPAKLQLIDKSKGGFIVGWDDIQIVEVVHERT